MQVDAQGWVQHTDVTLEHRPNIEHGALTAVNAVVLHRTGGSSASSALAAWKTKASGTHFLIGETGTIYQCASLQKACWHVGQLRARCRSTSTCDPADAKVINDLLHKAGASWKVKFDSVSKHEKTKSYPDRFPANSDSLGIEVVGTTDANDTYQDASAAQLKSLFWLLDELIAVYPITLTDVYSHAAIARKNVSEGVSVLNAYAVHAGS